MDLLKELQQIPGVSGDEGRIADFLEPYCRNVPDCGVRRIGDLVVAVRGRPSVAVFAHTDTVGFTQAYDRDLIAVGGPHVKGGEELRESDGPGKGRLRVRSDGPESRWRLPKGVGQPGSRWVYANPLRIRKYRISGPYLDNRAGVWNGVRTLEGCQDVAVLFTPGEEHSGRGALLGSRLVYEELGITRAPISDITWHTDSIQVGKGPAVSFRDRFVPRQRFLEEVVAAATDSGLPFQREVERSGGSDGSSIERSGFPIDWVFIGAPQKRSHTDREECHIPDLHGMVALYCYLVPALSGAAG